MKIKEFKFSPYKKNTHHDILCKTNTLLLLESM